MLGSCGCHATRTLCPLPRLPCRVQNTFGDQVKKIVQLDAGAKPPLTVAMVDLQVCSCASLEFALACTFLSHGSHSHLGWLVLPRAIHGH